MEQTTQKNKVLPPLLYRKFEKTVSCGIEFLGVNSFSGAIYPETFDPQDKKLKEFMENMFINLDKPFFVGKLYVQKLKNRYDPNLKFELCTVKIGDSYFNSYLLYLLLKKLNATNNTQIKIYTSTQANYPIVVVVKDKVCFLAPIILDEVDAEDYYHPDLAEFFHQ